MAQFWWFLLGFVCGIVAMAMYAAFVVASKESRAEEKSKEEEKIKCKVCGKRFGVTSKMRYLASETPAPLMTLTERTKVYECFDCPECGCQNQLNTRMPEFEVETDDREETEEETEQQTEGRTV